MAVAFQRADIVGAGNAVGAAKAMHCGGKKVVVGQQQHLIYAQTAQKIQIVKSVYPQPLGRQKQCLRPGAKAHTALLGGLGHGVGVCHGAAMPQCGKGLGKAHLLTVIAAKLAGSAAVDLQNGNVHHRGSLL